MFYSLRLKSVQEFSSLFTCRVQRRFKFGFLGRYSWTLLEVHTLLSNLCCISWTLLQRWRSPRIKFPHTKLKLHFTNIPPTCETSLHYFSLEETKNLPQISLTQYFGCAQSFYCRWFNVVWFSLIRSFNKTSLVFIEIRGNMFSNFQKK